MDLRDPRSRIVVHRVSAPILVGLATLSGWGALSALEMGSGSTMVARYGAMLPVLGLLAAIALAVLVWATARPPVESLSAEVSRDMPSGLVAKATVARMLQPIPIARAAVRLPHSWVGPALTALSACVATALLLPDRGDPRIAEAIGMLVLVTVVLIFVFSLSAETRPASKADYHVVSMLHVSAGEVGLVFPPPSEARAYALGGHAYLRDYVWAAVTAMLGRGEAIMLTETA